MPATPSFYNKHIPKINLLAYLVLVALNIVALQVPFWNKTPGDISDLYPNLLTPADFTFKIWSLIYIALGLFVFRQSKFIVQKQNQIDTEITTIGFWFVGTCVLNILWLFAWESLHIPSSFVLILLLWGILIYINYRLTMLGIAKRWYSLPFSLYLGWICVTALANLNVLLFYLEFDFFGLHQEVWTTLLIGLGILGTLFVLYLNGDIIFTAVLIWAYFGIYWKNTELVAEGNLVSKSALFAMVFLGLMALVSWKKRNARAS